MRNDDQWFVPGDKVMRVAYAVQLGLRVVLPLDALTDFGNVLCVERCWSAGGYNWVTFIGIPNGPDDAWYACCFRRVSEIKLCVRAAKHLSNPVEKEETQSA